MNRLKRFCELVRFANIFAFKCVRSQRLRGHGILALGNLQFTNIKIIAIITLFRL